MPISQILLGSDCPFVQVSHTVNSLLELGLSEADLSAITRDNAAAVPAPAERVAELGRSREPPQRFRFTEADSARVARTSHEIAILSRCAEVGPGNTTVAVKEPTIAAGFRWLQSRPRTTKTG
jgi:hypothetical protein